MHDLKRRILTALGVFFAHARHPSDRTPLDRFVLTVTGPVERAVDWGIKPGSTVFYKVVAVGYDGTATGPGLGRSRIRKRNHLNNPRALAGRTSTEVRNARNSSSESPRTNWPLYA